ncbi:(S)-8-oxocitronellyl enol synthase CYC2 [Musa acuminata AAA Group]|uniref:(S)-8-oxocitronellyl enol synthase CYC2 n=1 Tax=Musa acuminata AAA Group TaxID=214697 RepID=UPI0031E3824B
MSSTCGILRQWKQASGASDGEGRSDVVHVRAERRKDLINPGIVRCSRARMMMMMSSTAAAAASGGGGGGIHGDGSAANVALVAGATGLVGRELVTALLLSACSREWKLVYGVARCPPETDDDGDRHGDRYRFVACNMLDRDETMAKLGPLGDRVTHVFWVTWASQFPLNSQECCDQNRAMISNALDALLLPSCGGAFRHFALQTGTKHYTPLEAGGSGSGCFDEDSPRAVGGDVRNFYYVQEDLLEERLRGRRISWSVHRPGLLLGASRRSHFNLVGSLCVYASICRHLGLPFLFYGNRLCWEEPSLDASDARLVAQQHIWWATSSPEGHQGEAFNAINGTAFTWKEVWPLLAAKFGMLPPAVAGTGTSGGDVDAMLEDLVSERATYVEVMGDKGGAWEEIVEKEGLRSTRMEDLANWGFLDALFGLPFKILASNAKARRLGFTAIYRTPESLLYWVDRMREDRLIPSW